MSKFDNVIAEAAYAIAGHGFADEESGSVEETDGWNALVTVSSAVLLNLHEFNICERFRDAHQGATMFVWIREDSDGFVRIIDMIWDTNRESLKRVEDRWSAWQEELDDLRDGYPEHTYLTPSPGLVALHPDLDPMECGECGEVHPNSNPGDTIPRRG